jgi:hypothetical protein
MRFLFAGLLRLGAGVACALVLASVASASRPTHTSSSFSTSFAAPAGTFCNVAVKVDVSIQNDVTTLRDGTTRLHTTDSSTYTNLATGATATLRAVVNDNSAHHTSAGLHARIRAANGKLVDIVAGLITYDRSGLNVVRFTPNANPNVRPLICGAIGAKPA